MARTRQTARKSTGGPGTPRHNLLGIQENRELMEKLIQRNCMATMKNSLQNVVQEDKLDIQTKFSPYRDCLKVARLWILKDLLQNHSSVNNNADDQNITVSALTVLPLDVKIEIISFIPTYSNVYGGATYYDKRGAIRKTISVRDPWFFTYIKHRLVSQSVRNNLEQSMFKRMKDETLDLTVFLNSISPILYSYRVKVIKYLLEMQNKYLDEKSTDYKFFNLPTPDTQKPLKDPIYPEFREMQDDSDTQNDTTSVDDKIDLNSMNLDELEAIEKNLVEELYTTVGNFKPKFKKESSPVSTWKTLEGTQSTTRREIHSALSYYEVCQTFQNMDEDTDEELEMAEMTNDNMNDYVKALKICVSDMSSPLLLAEIVAKLNKIERLEMECYDTYEGGRNMMFFINYVHEETLESLESVTVTYFDRLSVISNTFAMLAKLSSAKTIFLKVIVDTTEIAYIFATFPNHNIYVNSEKVQDIPTSERSIYISSINMSDIQKSNNPWYSTKGLFSIVSNEGQCSIETMKDIATFVLTRYPPASKYLFLAISYFM